MGFTGVGRNFAVGYARHCKIRSQQTVPTEIQSRAHRNNENLSLKTKGEFGGKLPSSNSLMPQDTTIGGKDIFEISCSDLKF
jgi:hypothetical protein